MLSKTIKTIILLTSVACFISCSDKSSQLTSQQMSEVRDSALKMTQSIASSVSQQGPIAWLHYFEDTSAFFMASAGQLVFPSNDSAKHFIKNKLVHMISRVELQWQGIIIDPLTTQLAEIRASYHENITNSTGKTVSQNGYFTGLAHQTSKGWKLLNAHWSTMSTQ